MDDRPVIASFDIATMTGVCWGRVGRKAEVFTWNMRKSGPSRSARLYSFFQHCEEFFAECALGGARIDQLWYEAPMSIVVMNKIGASDDTVALLRGMVGVLEVCAVRAGIRDIKSFSVQDAREHLTGKRRHGRTKSGQSLGKIEVMRVAKMLGVEVANDNEGDAFAGWSYACGLANPRLALAVTPLFAGKTTA
jgi:hypothetical protein